MTMAKPITNSTRRQSDLHLESIARVSSLPIVGSGFQMAGNIYGRIKRSNSLMNWSLDAAEQSLAVAAASAKPAILVLNKPISTVDQLICRGIEIVQQKVPAVHMPPHLLYRNTREFMNNKIVRPMLKRAGSVTQIGSQAADAAADSLDGALTFADQYIDRYLPGDPTDKTIENINSAELVSKTARTIKHGARFSKKVQRRLTRRTLAEARALKHQGVECIQVLIYVTKLIATDPIMAYQKAEELWSSLSLSEPENQARPETLEQLLVLLTRESARRIVHLVNASAGLTAMIPRRIRITLMTLSHQLSFVLGTTMKVTPLVRYRESAQNKIFTSEAALQRLSISINSLLERTAIFLAGRPTPNTSSALHIHDRNYANDNSALRDNRSLNGTD